MKKEICHMIRASNQTFDSDQWSAYCNDVRYDDSKRIYNTFGKYTFNDFDCCINPDKEKIIVKEGTWGYYVEIETAECGNGIWVFGLNYSTGTGGGGFAPSWSDKVNGKDDDWHSGYTSERDCKIAAAEKAIRYLRSSYNITNDNRGVLINSLIRKVKDYLKVLKRPQVVQLELF